MDVEQCDFSIGPVFRNAIWPLDAPPGTPIGRVADMYLQSSRYVDVGLPKESVRVETSPDSEDGARCSRTGRAPEHTGALAGRDRRSRFEPDRNPAAVRVHTGASLVSASHDE